MKFPSLLVRTAALAAATAIAGAASADIFYVDGDNGNDELYPGDTWLMPFKTLQKALDAAEDSQDPSNQIWVKAGTYYPDEGPNQTDGDTTASFDIPDGVVVLGGFDGTEQFDYEANPATNITVLSGDIDQDGVTVDADNSNNVVTVTNVGSTTRIDGFAITGGFSNYGAGMKVQDSSPAITRCRFIGNSCHLNSGVGAAIAVSGSYEGADDPVRIANCTIRDNSSGYRGPLYADSASLVVLNCLIVENDAANNGGGVVLVGSDATLANCTISNNAVTSGAGGIVIFETGQEEIHIRNCILWGNSSGDKTGEEAQVIDPQGTASYTWNCIENLTGSLGGTGNIRLDPLFVNAAAGDYRLNSSSPCINFSYGSIEDDLFDLDSDMDSSEPTPDLDLFERIINGVADMGAHELQTCLGDLDGDGDIDGDDEDILRSNLGGYGPGDLNGDRRVDETDIALLYGGLYSNEVFPRSCD